MKDCLKDVKLALKLDYPKDLRHKLYLRMAQCYLELDEKQAAVEALLQADNMINEISDDISSKKKSKYSLCMYLKRKLHIWIIFIFLM